MAAGKVLHGARCKVNIVDAAGNATPIGIFSQISWGSSYDVTPAFILGRFSAATTEYTGADIVSVSASGFRVLDHGPYEDGRMPALQDLLNADFIQIVIDDRQSKRIVATIEQVRVASWDTSLNAKGGLQDISMRFIGLKVSDESVKNDEAANAAVLPNPLPSP